MNIRKEIQDFLAGKGPSGDPAQGKSHVINEVLDKRQSVVLVSPKMDVVMSRDMLAKLGSKGLKKMGLTVGRFI